MITALTLEIPAGGNTAVVSYHRGDVEAYLRRPDMTITTPVSGKTLGVHPWREKVEDDPAAMVEFLRDVAARLPEINRLETGFHGFMEAFFSGDPLSRRVPLREAAAWLEETLDNTIPEFDPAGWFVCRGGYLTGPVSEVGKRWLMPYGGKSTHLSPPAVPFSPPGTSVTDMSTVVAVLTRESYAEYLEQKSVCPGTP